MPKMIGAETMRRVAADPPNARAVLGGLLIAVAALASWRLGAPDASPPAGTVVIATRAIPAGARISGADVEARPIALPARQQQRAFATTRPLIGQTARARIEPDEIVERSMLGRPGGSGAARELSFSVGAAWAVGGDLTSGDLVDVVVTYGDGAQSSTRAVLEHVRISQVTDAGSGGIGDVDEQIVTVVVADPASVLAAANAVRAGQVTLVRTAARSSATLEGTYRPTGHD